MANYSEYEVKQIERADPDDAGRARRLLAEVYRLEIPALVLNRAGIRHVQGKPIGPPFDDGPIRLEPCVSSVVNVMGAGFGDFGIHIDPFVPPIDQYEDDRRRFNIHTTTAGRCAVRLMIPRPDIHTDTLACSFPGLIKPGERFDEYEKGRVDTDLFLPVCYEADLGQGDTLAFFDWRTPHDFWSPDGEVREYDSGLYPAHDTSA